MEIQKKENNGTEADPLSIAMWLLDECWNLTLI